MPVCLVPQGTVQELIVGADQRRTEGSSLGVGHHSDMMDTVHDEAAGAGSACLLASALAVLDP